MSINVLNPSKYKWAIEINTLGHNTICGLTNKPECITYRHLLNVLLNDVKYKCSIIDLTNIFLLYYDLTYLH